MRISGRSARRNVEIPTDPGPVILKGIAAAHVRERHLCTDPMPDLAIEGFVEIVAPRQRGPLFDSVGRYVIWINRATYSVAVAEDLREAVAGIRALKVGIGGPKKYAVRRTRAAVTNHYIRSVGLVSDDIRIGLLNPKARRGDIHNGDDFKWITRCARAGNRGLANRRENDIGSEVASCCSPVISKIGRVQRPRHGDERAAVPWNYARRIELVGVAIRDMLGLAA